jgi:hypothetical protein
LGCSKKLDPPTYWVDIIGFHMWIYNDLYGV